MEHPNKSILEAALEGLEAHGAKIDEYIASILSMMWRRESGRLQSQATDSAPAPRKRRRLSAAARKRIADATRKRWAAWRRAQKAG